MRSVIVDSTGRILAKDLVVGYPQQPQRVGGVVEQPPTSQQVGGRRKRRRGDHTHDPERPGGLLNGTKP